MSYYGYHPRIKQRIRAGELVDYYFTDKYPRIGPALVLVFNTAPALRPVRPHRWPEYQEILQEWRGLEHDIERGKSPERVDASRPA